jgi:hypothetical protein
MTKRNVREAQIEMDDALSLLETQMYEAFKIVRALHTSPMGKCDYDPEEFYVDVQARLEAMVTHLSEAEKED